MIFPTVFLFYKIISAFFSPVKLVKYLKNVQKTIHFPWISEDLLLNIYQNGIF
jgi:hypothetical protein